MLLYQQELAPEFTSRSRNAAMGTLSLSNASLTGFAQPLYTLEESKLTGSVVSLVRAVVGVVCLRKLGAPADSGADQPLAPDVEIPRHTFRARKTSCLNLLWFCSASRSKIELPGYNVFAAVGLSRAFSPLTKARNLSLFKSPKRAASLRLTLMGTGKPFRIQLMGECCSNTPPLTHERNGH
ncbi:hypothetical protein HO173_010539 [Letharia columbiana]|uniref:Uncharacterized protein n=1 Tax=Letharia columbiana TaxID=112416 RepID=A0A8H6FMJ7_9LECA|nr:uncharacterized protein HO173_010539 [Letharia columbiana]KAF6231207.1 hypothetical protein HO173_010539 [Letharia columbiana]